MTAGLLAFPASAEANLSCPNCDVETVPADGSKLDVANVWLTRSSLRFRGLEEDEPCLDQIGFEAPDGTAPDFECDHEIEPTDHHDGFELRADAPGDYEWNFNSPTSAEAPYTLTIKEDAVVDDTPPILPDGRLRVEQIDFEPDGPTVIGSPCVRSTGPRWNLTFPAAEDDTTDPDQMRYLVQTAVPNTSEILDSLVLTDPGDESDSGEVTLGLGAPKAECTPPIPDLGDRDTVDVLVRAIDLSGNISEDEFRTTVDIDPDLPAIPDDETDSIEEDIIPKLMREQESTDDGEDGDEDAEQPPADEED